MKTHLMVAGLLIAMVAGVAWAAGDWSAAKSAVEDFKSKQTDFVKLTKEETEEIVTAICNVDETERKAVAADIVDRVKNKVRDEASTLQYKRDQAYKMLDDVLADEALKDSHSDAKSLRDDVATRWASFERMKARLAGSNHPVVRFMLEQGQQAHDDRQKECDAKELTLNSGRVDCLMATGSVCQVIELKPDNSNAISKGNDQVLRYTRELNDELTEVTEKKKESSSVLARLYGLNAKFKECKKFEYRVDCYKLCPRVDEQGDYSEARADWRKSC